MSGIGTDVSVYTRRITFKSLLLLYFSYGVITHPVTCRVTTVVVRKCSCAC